LHAVFIKVHYLHILLFKPEDVEEFIKKETKSIPIILYPGDKWILGQEKENNKAIELYENDFAKEHVPHKNSPKIPLDELQTYSNNYIKNIRERNNWTLIKLAHSISFLKTAKIYLKDLELSITFDLVHGISKSNFLKKDVDIITDSDSLAFAFKFDFGADTLLANARFRKSGGRTMIFFRQFMIGTLNNNGRTFPLGIIGFLLRERSMWKSLFVEAILGNYDFQ